jgi:putative membrane protein
MRAATPKMPWALFAGFLLLAAFWLGPLPAMSRTAFSAHMILHLGVVALVAPLFAIGLVQMGLRLDQLPRVRRWIMVVVAAEMLVVWGWHAPYLHEAAARHVAVFVLQQLSFLIVGMAIWLLGFATRSREATAYTMLGFFLTFAHMTMLGMILLLAPRLIYPAELCLGAFGFEQLEDQRFGGILMAAWSGVVYLGGAIALGCRLLASDDKQATA